MIELIERLLKDWHGVGREKFEKDCKNLNYQEGVKL